MRAEYPYLYETHMHTAEGSKCGQCAAKDMVRAYKEAGYAGVMVTDHNWGGNTAVDTSLPWDKWLDRFFEGYHHAKEEGDRIGLPVYLGYEATQGHGHDFLIYGFTIDWMKQHPELKTAGIPEQFELIHSCGGMVIQAHPYREADYIDRVMTFPQYADGIELFNAGHLAHKEGDQDHSIWNEKAVALAREHHLPGTAGSDQHHTKLFGGGVAFPTPLRDLQDYMDRIRSGADYILTDGKRWYDKYGVALSE
ncbi:MAG: PHP domain-containing protein [Lachnospiraceae bacterium]|nr:PHP domain-containing protein [Lachnospiraceae bacterium]